MENNKPKPSMFKQFLGKIANLKTSTINKSDANEVSDFKLFLDRQETFVVEKDLSKETMAVVEEFNIPNKVPEFAKDLNLKPGIYSHGVATNPDVDIENESVEVEEDVFGDLTKAPYNKVFIAHDKKAISSGTIKFAGVVNGDKVLLEQLNEAHPEFRGIAGSIANKNLDSYSISGQASKERVFDKALGREIIKRKVLKAHEVSRTSCPVNAGASIDGLFFVKSKAGGYAYSQEDSQMENTDVQAIQKSIADLSGAVEKSNTDMNVKIDGMAKGFEERLGVVETFTKSLKEEAANLNKAEDGADPKPEEKPKEDPKPEEAEKPKEEVAAEDPKKEEEVKKSNVEERLAVVEKSLLEPSKAVAKVPTSTVTKSVATPMLNHAISGLGYLGRGN